MSPTSDIESQATSNYNRLRRELSLSLRTDPPLAIKEGNEAINHNWVSNYVCTLPQNIHAVTYLFVASDNLFKLYGFTNNLSGFIDSRHKIQIRTALLADVFSNQRYIWIFIQSDGNKNWKIFYIFSDRGILA